MENAISGIYQIIPFFDRFALRYLILRIEAEAPLVGNSWKKEMNGKFRYFRTKYVSGRKTFTSVNFASR